MPDLIQCHAIGCGVIRRDVNNWYVVLADDTGVHLYKWEKAPNAAMKNGKHFCGIAHAVNHASKMLTPDTTNVSRESTLELKPPLGRDGTVQA